MTRLITAGILLAFIIGCCAISSVTITSYANNLTELLDDAESVANNGDMEGARALAQKAEAAYTNSEGIMFLFVYHSLVEDLGEELATLPNLATSETKDDFLSQLDLVRVIVTHLRRDNRPSLRSIF